jgi:hypothetical protein
VVSEGRSREAPPYPDHRPKPPFASIDSNAGHAPKLPLATAAESGGAGWAARGEGRQPRFLHPLKMAEVAVPRQMFADILSLIAPFAGTTLAGYEATKSKCGSR